MGRIAAVGARIMVDQERIADLCRRWRIRELALFGSVLRDDFRTDSDVDVLVEFEPGHTPGFAFAELQDELRAILGREVDLVTKPGLRNPFRRHEILRTREVLYAA